MLRDTFLIHATTFRKFQRMCVCVCVSVYFVFFSFPFYLHFFSSCTSYPSFRACMGCCLYIMYVKISFILVCLPKQTDFFFCVMLCCVRFIFYFFFLQIYQSFSFVGEVGVGCRSFRCYSQKKMRVQQTLHRYTHISYTI